jgi:hypothetical protein
VQEEADAVLHAQLPQFGAQRNQVVVMHPDEIVGLEQRRRGGGKRGIDAQIALEGVAPEFEQAESIVEAATARLLA